MTSGILMMVCCCRLSPVPHSDDVHGVVSTCLPVATLSLCLGRALPLEWITELCSEKNQNIKQSCRPVPHAEPMWAAVENHSTYENQQRFCCCPSRGQKSEKLECVRAWSWLSSKEISIRRQVCSACPHSCSCL